MDYSLMTTNYLFLAAALFILNAGSLNSQAYQSPLPTASDRLVRLGLPPGIDPGDAVAPDWRKGLDNKTLAAVDDMTAALRKYMRDRNVDTPLPETLTLDDLVKAKYLKEIPPAPPGKKFAIARARAVVVVIDSK